VLAALPPEISFIAACFTHSLLPGPDQEESRDRLATLRCFLPASEEVLRLKVIFYRACTSAHDPVPEEAFDVVFSAVYEAPLNTSSWDEARVLHVHAVMFMFLALASAYDTALPAFVGVLFLYCHCAYAYVTPRTSMLLGTTSLPVRLLWAQKSAQHLRSSPSKLW
jgi:hypothetical protein